MAKDEHGTQQTPADLPEYYVNATKFYATPYDVVIDHFLRAPAAGIADLAPQVRIRMSLQHAWIVTKILDKLIREVIEKQGPIPLPLELLAELGLKEEYLQEAGSQRHEPGTANK